MQSEKNTPFEAATPQRGQSFCILPWIQVHIKNDGSIYPCCNMGEVKNERIQKINFQEDENKNIENSHLLRKLRTAMLKGEFPRECEGCYKIERSGAKSVRQTKNKKYENDIPKILSEQNSELNTNGILKSLDLRLGNTCNLKCRMCWPASSSALIQESIDLGFLDHNRYKEVFGLRFDAYRKLIDKNPSLESVSLAGGEPFLIPEFYQIIDHMIKADRASYISLTIHTNLTKIPPNFIEKLLFFREIKFLISIDGVGPINSYIRHPSNWEKIVENIHLVNQWSENSKFRTQINITAQAMNILNMPDVLHFSMQQKNFFPPVLTELVDPPELSIKSLPEELLQIAKIQLQQFRNSLAAKERPPKWTLRELTDFSMSLESLIVRLSKTSSCSTSFLKFVQRLEKVDRYRKTSYADYGLFLNRPL